ncbi:putative ATP-dependent RNA helicase DHR1 [Neophaeococcomyces mojaviensis]|uniref:ATP-dependent RNA helicase DHR1 n=1 Tax=Neophaeococcomyces mojaviensis TaxID=3383035 RepID=A0ACC3ACS8_9EURO|nr:putative ATP-dependent RNA helicase DHR1 [Knufia sp. JES_112]
MKGVAWISGAGHGIGRAVALAFANEGCDKLALVDINEEYLNETSRIIQESHGNIQLDLQIRDLRQPSEVQECIAQVAVRLGSINYAVNVAGIMASPLPSTELSLDDWDAVLNLNLRGTWLCSKYILQQMVKQAADGDGQKGAIVNIASIMGVLSLKGPPNYVSSKHAIIGLTKADAEAYGPHGIRVNCVSPGLIDSDFSNRMPIEAIPTFMEPMIKRTPLQRAGLPGEIAQACIFLVSNKASFITGANLIVDGGYTVAA